MGGDINIDKIIKNIKNGEISSFVSTFGCSKYIKEEGLTKGHSPILQASFQTDRTEIFWGITKSFEMINLELRHRVLTDGNPTEETGLARVDGVKLSSRITSELEYYRSRLTHGCIQKGLSIHIEGLQIDGDLILNGLDFPCSIRLINCYINGCLGLARTQMVSLDLSGSIIRRGLSAPHVQIKGAARLRRTTVLSIVDFGAATITGPLDCGDSIVIPQNLPPTNAKWVADRGLINFGLAKVGKEMRLNRVRWFGGVNMRGMDVDGSLFMTDAIVRAPVAVAEKIAIDALGDDLGNCAPHHVSASNAEMDLARLLVSDFLVVEPWMLDAEKLEGVSLPGCPTEEKRFSENDFEGSLLGRLLFESIPVQSSAIRADGASIHGVFNAESMRIGGRVRFKKLNVKSALTMSGSHFRTFRSFRECLSNFKETHNNHLEISRFCDFVVSELDTAFKNEPNARRQYAIDLRRAVIGASLELRKDSRNLVRAPNSSDYSANKNSKRAHLAASKAKVAKQIAMALCEEAEDPTKYLQVFFDRPGEINRFIDKEPSHHSDRQRYYRQARTILNSHGRRIDPRFYATLDEERAAETRPPLLNGMKRIESLDLPPARIYKTVKSGEEAERHHREVIETLSDVGPIKCTLLIGEISIAGAQIGGSVSLLGFVANVFGDEVSARDTLVLDNAVIRDDFDLRDSVGLSGISAEQVTIGGSLRMANPPQFDLKHDRYHPIRRRALLVGDKSRPEHPEGSVRSRYNLKRATIGGDADLVFDKTTGPAINLAFSEISGKLTFLPARGGVELNRAEYNEEAFKAKQRLMTGSGALERLWTRWSLDTLLLLSRIPGFQKCGKFAKRRKHIAFSEFNPRDIVQSYKPDIDLRNVTTTVLGHPPSAWPEFDGLRLEGLNYENTKELGPLLTRRRTWRMVSAQSGSNRVLIVLSFLLAALLTSFVPWMLDYAAKMIADTNRIALGEEAFQRFNAWLSALFSGKLEPARFVETTISWVRDFFTLQPPEPSGEQNIWSSSPSSVLFGDGNIRFLQFIAGGSLWILLMRIFTAPKSSDGKPMAVDYLKLQRRKFNVRRVSAAVHPFQPYIHAAKTLRASGNMLSADIVELERLRMRRASISWRTAGLLRVLLKLTDMTMRYGFAPIRLLGLTLLLLAIGSMMTTAAKRSDIVEAVSIETMPLSDTMRGNTGRQGKNGQKRNTATQDQEVGDGYEEAETPTLIDRRLTEIDDPEPISNATGASNMSDAEDGNDLYGSDFSTASSSDLSLMNPFFYVLDVTVPFLDLGQEIRFVFVRKDTEATAMTDWWAKHFWMVPIILKLVGWVLTSLIAISVASRLETIMARNEES